jgi:hypothetical protein
MVLSTSALAVPRHVALRWQELDIRTCHVAAAGGDPMVLSRLSSVSECVTVAVKAAAVADNAPAEVAEAAAAAEFVFCKLPLIADPDSGGSSSH